MRKDTLFDTFEDIMDGTYREPKKAVFAGKRCNLTCINSKSNKYYNMIEKDNGTFDVEYGAIGDEPRKTSYPMDQWDSIYQQKLKHGYKEAEDEKNAIVSSEGMDPDDFVEEDDFEEVEDPAIEESASSEPAAKSGNGEITLVRVTPRGTDRCVMIDNGDGTITLKTEKPGEEPSEEKFSKALAKGIYKMKTRMGYVEQ